jgi:hypothetical protein
MQHWAAIFARHSMVGKDLTGEENFNRTAMEIMKTWT